VIDANHRRRSLLLANAILLGALILHELDLTGAVNTVGFIAVHVVPHWSGFSQPFGQVGASALSWANLALTVGAAAALAIVPVRLARRPGEASTVAGSLS